MKFSGWIFLWLMPVVVASHGSVPPDTTHPLLEIQRRYRRLAGPNKEPAACKAEDLNADPDKCCQTCPPGYFYRDAPECGAGSSAGRCSRCSNGTYTEHANRGKKCKRCDKCDVEAWKEVVPCRHDQNAKCDCKEGFYKHGSECYSCSKCANRTVTADCTQSSDTQCGSCHPDFYEEPSGTCQPCTQSDHMKPGCHHRSTTPKTTTSPKSHIQDPQVLVLSICMVVLLILGGLLCCFLHLGSWCERVILRWKPVEHPKQSYQFHLASDTPQGKGNTASSDQYCENHIRKPSLQTSKTYRFPDTTTELLVNTGVCSAVMPMEMDCKMPKEDLQVADSWPAAVLYAIIREVPVRRWKEFLRLLSVQDGQMERVELEVGPCYLEQQYQMLRLWSQRAGVELEAVYSALHSMNLSGCAQDLQEKLQQLQQQAA